MEIIIGSEGKGIWGAKVINYLLNNLGYKNIKYINSNDCNIIISSHFFFSEKKWNKDKNKCYIYWSGESYNPQIKYKNSILMSTIKLNMNKCIYIPFFLYSPYLYKKKCISNINNRKYLLAYCNSNKIKIRENLFNLFVEKTSDKLCHSYGKCFGKYYKTKKKSPDGGWSGNELINTYKNYKFVIAMENKSINGYVTEKIINAYFSGAIPIYYGSSNINDFFNKKSFINVSDFNTLNECVDYVINMSEEEIKKMSEEPFYNVNNEIVNLLNPDFDQKNNKTLKKYVNLMKKCLFSLQ